ncbi:hypothetical protein ACPPVT_12430 [Angustibacter sp. McL0619]|uniref:hypothetical protein n=1 Tax=Angustibacter sp. McL0619 TaxID=3415676 RepID=UPI003CF96572
MTDTPPSETPPSEPPAEHRGWRGRADRLGERVTRSRVSTVSTAVALLLVGGIAGFGIAAATDGSDPHSDRGRLSESQRGHHGERGGPMQRQGQDGGPGWPGGQGPKGGPGGGNWGGNGGGNGGRPGAR